MKRTQSFHRVAKFEIFEFGQKQYNGFWRNHAGCERLKSLNLKSNPITKFVNKAEWHAYRDLVFEKITTLDRLDELYRIKLKFDFGFSAENDQMFQMNDEYISDMMERDFL